jgi:hypothetical protein
MQFDDSKTMAPEKLQAKLAQREKLMTQQYAQLPEDEKEKDRVVARAMLQAITGDKPGVTESSQRVDRLVTRALKIMRGGTTADAIAALKTVLGEMEYNERPQFYDFYIRQMVDMYGKQGMAEDLDANQKRVGQLGPTEKVGPKGAVGKLVGASESIREGQEDLDTIRRLLGK